MDCFPMHKNARDWDPAVHFLSIFKVIIKHCVLDHYAYIHIFCQFYPLNNLTNDHFVSWLLLEIFAGC